MTRAQCHTRYQAPVRPVQATPMTIVRLELRPAVPATAARSQLPPSPIHSAEHAVAFLHPSFAASDARLKTFNLWGATVAPRRLGVLSVSRPYLTDRPYWPPAYIAVDRASEIYAHSSH